MLTNGFHQVSNFVSNQGAIYELRLWSLNIYAYSMCLRMAYISGGRLDEPYVECITALEQQTYMQSS